MQLVSTNFPIKILKKEDFSFIICFPNAKYLHKVTVLELLIFIKVTTRFFVDFHAMEGHKVTRHYCLTVRSKVWITGRSLQDLLAFCDWNINTRSELILYFKGRSKGSLFKQGKAIILQRPHF
jgi:hypothetical protein